MRSSSIESDNTYDSSCSEKSSDRRRFNSSAARRRSCSERIRRRHSRHNTMPTPPSTSARAIAANSSGCCRNAFMAIYIQLSILRINLVLCLTLAACRGEGRPGISRAWPELGTMMSAAAWGADSERVARALDAVSFTSAPDGKDKPTQCPSLKVVSRVERSSTTAFSLELQEIPRKPCP